MEKYITERGPEQYPVPIKGIEINSLNLDGVDNLAELRHRLGGLGDNLKSLISRMPQMELVQREPRRIKSKHYAYPFSNCVTFTLGDEKGDLNFHISHLSMLFSLLNQEYDEVDYKEIQPEDIAVYYFKNEPNPNVSIGDHTFEHMGKITPDLKVISQFGEGDLGVYKHPIPLVFDSYGDSVVFMRKKIYDKK
jgi:hypothetical protein